MLTPLDQNETTAALYSGTNSFSIDNKDLNERYKLVSVITGGDEQDNESEHIKVNESIISGKYNTTEPNIPLQPDENSKGANILSAPELPDIGGHKIENAAFSLEPPGIDHRRRSNLSDEQLGEGPTVGLVSETVLEKEGHI